MNKVVGYKGSCFTGLNIREEAEDDYSKYVLKKMRKHEVIKGVGQIGLSVLKNLILHLVRSNCGVTSTI